MTPDLPLSLAVAVAGTALTLALPRKWALLPLAVSMCWHPSVLLMPPPQLSLTPSRFIALVLIGRCLLSHEIRSRFKWHLADTAVAFYFACVTVTQLMSTPMGPAINNRAGFFLSAILPYFCARFTLTDREHFYAFMKGMLWAAVPLALLGQVEQHTAWSPWDAVRNYGVLGPLPRLSDGWRVFLGELRARARGPFVQYIMFGWFFAVMMAMSTSLFFEKKKLMPWVVAWLIMPLGVVSSIASGPMMLAAMALGLTMLFPFRQLWKVGVGAGVVLFLAAMGYSNRSPMQVIANFGFDPNSSWYRYSLTNFVLEQGMRGNWIAGYGEVPGQFGRFHDLCIHWVWLLVIHGVVGLVGFYTMICAVGWELWKAKRKANGVADEFLLWSFMSMLVGSLGAMLVVALFSEMYYIYHLMLGVMANAALYVGAGARGEGVRHVGVLAQVNGKPVLLRYSLKPGQRLALVHPGEGGRVVAEPLKEEGGKVKVGAGERDEGGWRMEDRG